jgi:hypothetical protein
MATLISSIVTSARTRLIEPTANFWSDAELVDLAVLGIRDLWRDIVDLKGEHYLTVDTTNVTYAANATQLNGVPTDVHKVYMIEPRDLSTNGPNNGLIFKPMDYNAAVFQSARAAVPIEPQNSVVYYAITQQGTPVAAPVVLCAPKVTSVVNVAFSYIPSLGILTSASNVPIPGEADNAIIAWTVAYARAKEREDRTPDPGWLAVFSTEKSHLLQSLGLRQYQEPEYVAGVFSEYWG